MITLPSEHPRSLWAATAVPAPETSPLSGDRRADVAIVGAGFTGLRAAIVLREAGVDVNVIDAGEPGTGASGRAGGQVNPIGHETPQTIEQTFQRDFGAGYGERCTKMYIESADELFCLIQRYGIECDAERHGWIRAAHGEQAQKQLEKMLEAWSEAGANLQHLDADAVQQRSGAHGYRSGWYAKSGGTVQPLSYTRGLARTALSLGAQVYRHTHAESITRSENRWRLHTDRGTITAEKILLCTNGYTDQLYPGLNKTIVPIIAIQSATQPLTEEQQQEILPERATFSDTRRIIYYFKKTADNRLVFGSIGTTDEAPGQPDHRRIQIGLKRLYPQFPGLEIAYIWGGRIGFTREHLPHLHQPAPGIIAGLGCNGRGIAICSVMGRLLAELAMGSSPGEMPLPVSPIKPYPLHRFHRTGIKLTVPWWGWLDRMESR